MKIEHHHIDFKYLIKKPEKSSLFNCSYIVSPYTGCEYNCVSCLDFIDLEELKKSAERIQVKENVLNLLKKELKKGKKGIVCIVGYQPMEREERIVRKILETLNARRFPVHIITKSDIVLEDLNLLSRISENRWCAVSFCINTMDEEISSIFEPDAPSPWKRTQALEKVAEAGIYTGIALMPIIPYITDSEEQLKDIIGTATKAKANYILPMPLTLGDNYRPEFIKVIKRHFPKLLIKYRRLYEFSSTPDLRYSNRLKHRIDLLLKKYEIKDSIPSYPIKEGEKQVNIDVFLPKR